MNDSQKHPASPRQDDDARAPDETIEQMVEDIRRGRGLGGRTLGELGTTGDTKVGAKIQEENQPLDAPERERRDPADQ